MSRQLWIPSEAEKALIEKLLAARQTAEKIASKLGISPNTLRRVIKTLHLGNGTPSDDPPPLAETPEQAARRALHEIAASNRSPSARLKAASMILQSRDDPAARHSPDDVPPPADPALQAELEWWARLELAPGVKRFPTHIVAAIEDGRVACDQAILDAPLEPSRHSATPGNWSFACPDWAERLEAAKVPFPDLPLDAEAAARAIAVFDALHLPDIPGAPLMREAAGDWFRSIVAALHGSMDPNGERRVREPYILVPKKNAKTSYSAALMFSSLLINERPYAEFLLVAPTQPIAEIAFRQIEGIVAADPDLRAFIHVQTHLKKICHLGTNATLQIKSFSTDVLTGVKPAGILVDELHVVSNVANADRVIGQLRGGLISQPEAFLVFITTQSERPPAGIFKAELEKARKIRDGEIPGKMLPILFEFPKDDDWNDPTNWWMVTPNRGRSITIERLVEEYQTARDTGEGELRRWASQHLNVEVGLALHADRWPGADHWEENYEFGLTLKNIFARSEVLAVGIDMGGQDDLAAVAVIGREESTKNWLVWAHAFAHRILFERRPEIASRLRDFAEQGDLTITGSMREIASGIADIAKEASSTGLCVGIGLDSWGSPAMIAELADRGLSGPEHVSGGKDHR